MAEIHFNLSNCGNLNSMVQNPRALPPIMVGDNTPSTYMIINTHDQNPAHVNRYVGITTNLADRFNQRLRTIGELDFIANSFNNIYTIWGTVEYCNTVPNPILVLEQPNGGANGITSLNATIDGVNFNLEAVLIRLTLQVLSQPNETVSNQAIPIIQNTTQNPINITFDYPAFGNYAAGTIHHVWPAGQGL